MGRWLVLGGTRFLSRAVADAALRRGHDVVCVARGISGAVPPGARLVSADRDDPTALDGLRDERFDAVVDVARMAVPWVRAALTAVPPTAAHWSFVSSISVYADHEELGQEVGAPLLAPKESDHPDDYGAVKVASEDAVRDAAGDRALIVRAGLICGPGDRTDRFGYWPARFARGGPAVVPEDHGHPAQIIDVRDLADWIVAGGETRLTGTFDASGERSTLAEMLAEVAAAIAGPDLEPIPVAPDALARAGVGPWSGPRSLPLWLPVSERGMVARHTEPAQAAGLRVRPVADTARAALDHERELGLDRARAAGLSAADERDVLAAVGARTALRQAQTAPSAADHPRPVTRS